MKRFLFLLMVQCSVFMMAQLQPFSITAQKVSDETCPNNGAISWTTSGTTTGSVLTYTVVDAATGTTVTATSGSGYNGLPSGNYKIIATQTLGTQTNQATSSTISIGNAKIPLVYNSSSTPQWCGTDGTIILNVTSGRPSYTYQILDNNNNIVVSQTSNVFTGLVAGDYKVRVVDQCGAGTVQVVTVGKRTSDFSLLVYSAYTADCKIRFNIYTTGIAKYPLTYNFQYNDPATGQPKSVTTNDYNTFTIDNPTGAANIPLLVTVTDGCGVSAQKTVNANPGPPTYRLLTQAASCGGQYINIQSNNGIFKVKVTSPAGFDSTNYDTPGINTFGTYHDLGSTSNPLPAGTYTLELTDQCGNIQTFTRTVTKNYVQDLFASTTAECDSGLVTANLQGSSKLNTVSVIAAPQSFIDAHGSLPYQLPASSFYGSMAFLNHVKAGDTFTFSYNTTCDPTFTTKTITLPNPLAKPVITAEVTVNCTGQFQFKANSNISTGHNQYYLQKYFPATGLWGSPTAQYVPGQGKQVNSSQGYSLGSYTAPMNAQTPLINVPYGEGKYRIIVLSDYSYNSYVNPPTGYYYCDPTVAATFEISNSISIDNVYAWQCADGTYDIAVSASATSALTYSLVSDASNNATLVQDNGSNPIFHGLSGGTYYVRATNACGNFTTKKLEIAKLGKPGIRAVPDCTTGTMKLQVDGLDFLNFEWYKSTDPATILSTASTLNLGVYDASKAGLYKVRIYSTNALYCINSTQELQISVASLTEANPGIGQNATIQFNNVPTVNLYNYLTGPYDSFGTWTQVSGPSTSLLTGSDWNIAASAPGTYVFRYTVSPLCTGTAKFTDVTLKLEKICYKLPATASAGNPALPTTTGITILPHSNTGNGNWPMVRNGGWLAVEANSAGIVLNRVAFDAGGNPVGIPAANFVIGMAVYDTTNKCLKIYDGTKWSCYSTQTCPE